MIAYHSHPHEFRMGIILHSRGIDIALGWCGFAIRWARPKDPLEDLPTLNIGPCLNCSSTNWKSCNLTGDMQVSDCSECPDRKP